MLVSVSCTSRSKDKTNVLDAMNNLRIGMNRVDAEAILQNSISHQLCASDEITAVELYLFESAEIEQAYAIYAVYESNTIEGEILTSFSFPSAEFLAMPTFDECHQIN